MTGGRAVLLALVAAASCAGAEGGAADAGADAAPPACAFDGGVHAVGEPFAAGDGCNVCQCTGARVECSSRACDSCDGPRPAIEDCFTSRGYADCGAGGLPADTGPLACNDVGDCRWFAGGCIAEGFFPSLCPEEDICCHAGFPFAAWQLTGDLDPFPVGVSWWLVGNGIGRWTRERATTVSFAIDPDLPPGDSFACEGIPPGSFGDGNPCNRSEHPWVARVGDVVELTVGSDWLDLGGWYFVIELDPDLRGGPRARACQFWYTDVLGGPCPTPYEIWCATGSLILNRVPASDADLPGLIGVADLTFPPALYFPDGLHLTATFTL